MSSPLQSPFRVDCLTGKVALVTGGGSGICFQISRQIGEAYNSREVQMSDSVYTNVPIMMESYKGSAWVLAFAGTHASDRKVENMKMYLVPQYQGNILSLAQPNRQQY